MARSFNSVCRLLEYKGWQPTRRVEIAQFQCSTFNIQVFRKGNTRAVTVLQRLDWPAPEVRVTMRG